MLNLTYFYLFAPSDDNILHHFVSQVESTIVTLHIPRLAIFCLVCLFLCHSCKQIDMVKGAAFSLPADAIDIRPLNNPVFLCVCV